jgi:hypothetical protein
MSKVKPEFLQSKEADEVVVKLCNLYPNHLGHVEPKIVGCVSIANKEKNETQPDSRIRGIHQPDAMFCSVQYVLCFYQDCWDKYTSAQRSMMLFKNLIRIPDTEDGPDGSVLKEDLQDSKMLVKAFGVDYMENPALPDLSVTKQPLAADD